MINNLKKKDFKSIVATTQENTAQKKQAKRDAKIKLSIVIPHYNRAELIIQCLDSIVANNYPQTKYEVIVIDDCSTNDTDIVKNYSKIKNYIFHTLPINSGGASIPRNIGMGLAAGDYVLFIDSDDTITAGFLSKTMAIAIAGNCDIVNVPKSTDRMAESEMAKLYDVFPIDTIMNIFDEPKYNWAFFNDHQIHGRLLKLSLIRKHNIRFPEGVFKSEDRCFNRVFWTVARTAGVCTTERYNLITLDDPSTQLHQLKTTAEDEYNMIAFLLTTIIPIPEQFASLRRKSIVFNRWFESRYTNEISGSKPHLQLLATKFAPHLKLLTVSPHTSEKAMEFLKKVTKTI
jgi:glycosyltransferase involved in cell wall biosynthesis